LIEPLVKTEHLDFKTIFYLGAGIICNAIAFIVYYKGLKYTNAIKATILELIMPVFTVVFGYIFLGETLSALQVAASILLLLSIVNLELKDLSENS
jgi:drug/metabolite transporter (DMT)-like permease